MGQIIVTTHGEINYEQTALILIIPKRFNFISKSILKKHQKKEEVHLNAIEHLRTLGDIFKPGLVNGIDLKKVIDRFSKNSTDILKIKLVRGSER
ncbi:MAG: hypothetical protein ACN6O7_02350 [Sphingobacterium sp.]